MTDLNALRHRILAAAFRSGEPQHVPSALSILSIVAALYDSVLGVTPETWDQPGQNRFVLSKAHGCMALYAVLEAHGFIAPEELDRIGKPGGLLGGHPSNQVPGVEFATGSLGMGFGMAIGLAYAKKLAAEPGRVYCLIGDGEAQEGAVWESARLAATLKLDNLCLILDDNGSHEAVHWHRRFASYRFDTSVLLSTEPSDIATRLGEPQFAPRLVQVRTRKGHGVPALERDPAAWHRRLATPDEYREQLESLA